MIPPFRDPNAVATFLQSIELPDHTKQQLISFAEYLVANPQQAALYDSARQTLYTTDNDSQTDIAQAEQAMPQLRNALRGLLVLDCVRQVCDKQAARGVDPAISQALNDRHALAWLRGNFLGVLSDAPADWMPYWFRIVATGDMYRLGRLEFMVGKWHYQFRMFRRSSDGAIVALADDGLEYTAQGYLRDNPSLRTSFHDLPNEWRGNPVHPQGHILVQQISLAKHEWQAVLYSGVPVLEMHVPENLPMSLELLHDAMRQAIPFFAQYYPEHQAIAFTCNSWLFSPDLPSMLPAHSNILAWQRQGYLLPTTTENEWFLLFVFGTPTIDLATAPRDTSLRRAVINALEQGQPLRSASYVLLLEDLDRFGQQPYARLVM
jgi:hypothetical protein